MLIPRYFELVSVLVEKLYFVIPWAFELISLWWKNFIVNPFILGISFGRVEYFIVNPLILGISFGLVENFIVNPLILGIGFSSCGKIVLLLPWSLYLVLTLLENCIVNPFTVFLELVSLRWKNFIGSPLILEIGVGTGAKKYC